MKARKKEITEVAYDFRSTKVDKDGKLLYDEIRDESTYFINIDDGNKLEIHEDDFVIVMSDGGKYPINRDIFFENHRLNGEISATKMPLGMDYYIFDGDPNMKLDDGNLLVDYSKDDKCFLITRQGNVSIKRDDTVIHDIRTGEKYYLPEEIFKRKYEIIE